jgi:outer membrane protein assembly factor BamB
VLGVLGATLCSGCANFSGILDGNESPPQPFHSEPEDWTHPEYDAARTQALPAHAAPDTIPSAPTWTTTFETDNIEEFTSPVVAHGTVYVVLDATDQRGNVVQRLVALDARTGAERWRATTTEHTCARRPIVAGETVIWPGCEIRAHRAVDGSTLWTRESPNHFDPIVKHGLILSIRDHGHAERLEALDPATGRPYWTRREGNRDWNLVAADDEVFYVTLEAASEADGHTTAEGDEYDTLHAIDPETGATVWSTALVSPWQATVGSERLYVATGRPAAANVFAFDLDKQRVVWSDTRDILLQISDSVVGGDLSIGPVTAESVFVYQDLYHYAHDLLEVRDAASGELRWRLAPSGEDIVTFSEPVVAGDRVYLVENRDREPHGETTTIRVLDAADGTELTRVVSPTTIWRSPVIADGWMYTVRTDRQDTATVAGRVPK